MSSKTRFYVDGINDVSFINGMVHITCGNLERTTNPNEEPETVDSVGLALSVQGFLQSLQQMNAMVTVMRDKGILRDKAETATEAAE